MLYEKKSPPMTLTYYIKIPEERIAVLIGKDGKSRKLLEQLTNCDICVYGKTVGIIGSVERDLIARRAVEMILNGSMHATVYKFLETEKRKTKNREFVV